MPLIVNIFTQLLPTGCRGVKNMENLIEIIGINEENCTNCHQCIAVCPVKICSNGSGEVIKFNNDLCIGCGRCIEACIKSHGGIIEKSARFAIDDVKDVDAALSDDHEIVALVAPSAAGNFPIKKLIAALKRLGIKKVYDVSLGAEITIACYHEAIIKQRAKTPLIATPCPAVVSYIELNHPRLMEYLAPIGSPVYNLAVYVRSLHPDAELAFISPCLAKRREFRDSGMVKYNVTFQSIHRMLRQNHINIDEMPDGEFDNIVAAGISANFSTPGGLKESYLYHYPDTPASSIARVEGPLVFDRYLRKLERSIEKGHKPLPLMVDILACEKGCNMGVGCIRKYIDEVEYEVAIRAEQGIENDKQSQQLATFLAELLRKYSFEYSKYRDLSVLNQLSIPTESELQAIYTDMHKVEEKDFRNCAACGYNSCYHMAVAVFNKLNKVENCHLYQEKQLRIEQQALMNIHEELANVFDTMSDGVIVVNMEGRVSQANPAAKNIIGYSDEALIGVYVVDLFSGQAPKTLNLLQTGESFNDREIFLDGMRGKIHAAASGIPVFNEKKQVVGAAIILRPIAQVQRLVNKFTGAQASFTFDSIIGEDKQLKRSIKMAMKAGANDATVLLQAESGTGKEMFAQAIHNFSKRSDGPFVAINCAALPRELVGSELFGYVEGAFTGARRGGRPGKFELANKGTLFLDEIGDMPLEQQAILLRALQEKAILRVGGESPIQVDVRIIAATNQDLPGLIEQKRFRADLYYRLNVVQIKIPPLKERRKDINLLFDYFLKEMSTRLNRHLTGVDPVVLNYLESYDWPGNIRELQNVVERILLVSEDGFITKEHLPREIIKTARETSGDEAQSHAPWLSNRDMRKKYALEQEREQILKALDDQGGNISKAAASLGISRSTLYRKMKGYYITN